MQSNKSLNKHSTTNKIRRKCINKPHKLVALAQSLRCRVCAARTQSVSGLNEIVRTTYYPVYRCLCCGPAHSKEAMTTTSTTAQPAYKYECNTLHSPASYTHICYRRPHIYMCTMYTRKLFGPRYAEIVGVASVCVFVCYSVALRACRVASFVVVFT